MSEPSILSIDRAHLQSHIWTYKKRREEAKIKYGVGTVEYKKYSRMISTGLYSMKSRMAVIDYYRELLEILDKKITEFLGTSPKSKQDSRKVWMAKRLYYKYGLENGINGYFLRAYVNTGDIATPSKTRARFTKSFKDHPENKELWHKFKQYMEDTSNQFG